MRAGIGLVLAIGSALVVDPAARAAQRVKSVRIRVPIPRVTVRVPRFDVHRFAIRLPAWPPFPIRPTPSGEPLHRKVFGTLAVTAVCIVVGAAISHA